MENRKAALTGTMDALEASPRPIWRRATHEDRHPPAVKRPLDRR
jgi:hypothetical protein